MNIRVLGLISVAACSAAMPALFTPQALAHHSFAMFDREKTLNITGTVKEFEWSNPHAWIHIIADEAGKPVDWSFEMGSIGQVSAQGWKADSIKPGDKITVTAHPMRDGSRGGQYIAVALPDGRSLKNENAARQ